MFFPALDLGHKVDLSLLARRIQVYIHNSLQQKNSYEYHRDTIT
jgi:hypothetical protein